MTSDDDLLTELRPLFARVLSADPRTITLGADLRRDLEADSLDIAELGMVIEERCGLGIDERAVQEARTVGDVIALVQRIRAGKAVQI